MTSTATHLATYSVNGMTCEHCVAAVTEEVEALAGVRAGAIDLRPGGESLVTVSSEVPLGVEAVRAAVDEAGYTLTA
jgi:copper chaperone